MSGIQAQRALEEHGRLAVATAESEGRVTNARLQELTTAHARDLTFLLRRLVGEGFLEPHGDRRGAWYTVGEPPGQAVPDRGLHQSLHQTSSGAGSDDAVAAVARSSWAAREVVEAAILQVCRGQFVTVRGIATRLTRSTATVRNKYLPKLVAAGRLELRDPENPTIPEQAYRTVEESEE